MRQLTKEMASYAWAMTAFGAQQMTSLTMPPPRGQEHPATTAFRAVTDATEEQMHGIWRPVFRTGDTLQRWVIDLGFNLTGFCMPMPGAPSRGGDAGSERF